MRGGQAWEGKAGGEGLGRRRGGGGGQEAWRRWWWRRRRVNPG